MPYTFPSNQYGKFIFDWVGFLARERLRQSWAEFNIFHLVIMCLSDWFTGEVCDYSFWRLLAAETSSNNQVYMCFSDQRYSIEEVRFL